MFGESREAVSPSWHTVPRPPAPPWDGTDSGTLCINAVRLVGGGDAASSAQLGDTSDTRSAASGRDLLLRDFPICCARDHRAGDSFQFVFHVPWKAPQLLVTRTQLALSLERHRLSSRWLFSGKFLKPYKDGGPGSEEVNQQRFSGSTHSSTDLRVPGADRVRSYALAACPGPTALPHGFAPRPPLAWVLLRGGGCRGRGWERCREAAEFSWFPACMTSAKYCGGPPPPVWPQGEEGMKKKKENVGFVLAGELEPQGMSGKPQLGLPSSSARHDAPAGRQKGLLSPHPSNMERKAKPIPGPREPCGKRDFCREAAAWRRLAPGAERG